MGNIVCSNLSWALDTTWNSRKINHLGEESYFRETSAILKKKRKKKKILSWKKTFCSLLEYISVPESTRWYDLPPTEICFWMCWPSSLAQPPGSASTDCGLNFPSLSMFFLRVGAWPPIYPSLYRLPTLDQSHTQFSDGNLEWVTI